MLFQLLKLRNQLAYTNSQLKDLDAVNSTLNDEIRSLKVTDQMPAFGAQSAQRSYSFQASIGMKSSELSEALKREEQNLIEHNKKLQLREDEIASLKLAVEAAVTKNPTEEDELKSIASGEGGLSSVRSEIAEMAQELKVS